MYYNPEGLDMETEEFVESLGYFNKDFELPREQVGEMFEDLRERLDPA
jgi:hypothetical protein